MDPTTLVGNWIEEGQRVVDALVDSGLPIDAALWLYSSETERWELVVATPLRDTAGPQGTYRRINTVLDGLGPTSPMRWRSVTASSPGDDLIVGLRVANRVGKGIVGRPLSSRRLGGVHIDAAYVYRLADQAFPPVELPRHAAPLADAGRDDARSWNACVLAGLLGTTVPEVEELGLPEPLTGKAFRASLTQAQERGLVRRWEQEDMLGRPRARDDFEGFARWAYRISRWLHKGYYLVSLLRNGRLALVCGVREEHPQQPSPPEQVLVSSPAVAEEWLGASDYFRRDRPRDSGEFFVKPAAKHRGPG